MKWSDITVSPSQIEEEYTEEQIAELVGKLNSYDTIVDVATLKLYEGITPAALLHFSHLAAVLRDDGHYVKSDSETIKVVRKQDPEKLRELALGKEAWRVQAELRNTAREQEKAITHSASIPPLKPHNGMNENKDIPRLGADEAVYRELTDSEAAAEEATWD